MADKLTPLIVAALARAAAAPAGTPLVGSKADAGLFPPTAAAKPAARKALDDGLLAVVRPDPKPGRELCAATEKGLQFLVDQSSPRQVLEDFVRVLETREGEVADLLRAANRMADGIAGIKAAVAAVLPQVTAARVPVASPPRERGKSAAITPPAHAGGSPRPADGSPGFETTFGPRAEPMIATLDAPAAVADPLDDLAGAVLARLADWAASAAAGQDCPLPELYRSLTLREQPPTIGTFHDCLRQLHAAGQVYLHPWTGPLYALPEPAYALLAGHNVAYYASVRN